MPPIQATDPGHRHRCTALAGTPNLREHAVTTLDAVAGLDRDVDRKPADGMTRCFDRGGRAQRQHAQIGRDHRQHVFGGTQHRRTIAIAGTHHDLDDVVAGDARRKCTRIQAISRSAVGVRAIIEHRPTGHRPIGRDHAQLGLEDATRGRAHPHRVLRVGGGKRRGEPDRVADELPAVRRV